MDNAQKAIMIGVGLFVTIIIISIVLLITNLGTGMANDARKNFGNVSESLQNTMKSSYDKKILTAADVKNIYTEYKDKLLVIIEGNDGKNYSKTESAIEANNTSDLTNIVYYKTRSVNTSKTSGHIERTATFPSSFTTYIDSNATYKTYLIRDVNKLDNVIGIYCKIIK